MELTAGTWDGGKWTNNWAVKCSYRKRGTGCRGAQKGEARTQPGGLGQLPGAQGIQTEGGLCTISVGTCLRPSAFMDSVCLATGVFEP